MESDNAALHLLYCRLLFFLIVCMKAGQHVPKPSDCSQQPQCVQRGKQLADASEP